MSSESLNTAGAFSQAKDLKNRILFTLLLLVIYRLGTYVPLSGIDPQALKEMTAAELIVRWDHKTKPPKVLYSISTFGKTLKPVLDELEKWESENLTQIQKSLVQKNYNKFSKTFLEEDLDTLNKKH